MWINLFRNEIDDITVQMAAFLIKHDCKPTEWRVKQVVDDQTLGKLESKLNTTLPYFKR